MFLTYLLVFLKGRHDQLQKTDKPGYKRLRMAIVTTRLQVTTSQAMIKMPQL